MATPRKSSRIQKPKDKFSPSVEKLKKRRTRRNSAKTATIRANTSSSWDQNYEDLKRYRRRFGDCLVPAYQKPKFDDKATELHQWSKLSRWVSNQRHQYKLYSSSGKIARGKTAASISKITITAEKIQLLEKIGFQWNVAPPLENKKGCLNSVRVKASMPLLDSISSSSEEEPAEHQSPSPVTKGVSPSNDHSIRICFMDLSLLPDPIPGTVKLPDTFGKEMLNFATMPENDTDAKVKSEAVKFVSLKLWNKYRDLSWIAQYGIEYCKRRDLGRFHETKEQYPEEVEVLLSEGRGSEFWKAFNAGAYASFQLIHLLTAGDDSFNEARVLKRIKEFPDVDA